MSEARVRAAIDKADADRRTGEVLWRVRSEDGALDVTYGDASRPFFLASATKLATSAILAQLRVEGRVGWDAPVAALLPDLDLSGLSMDGSRDRSQEMTVREILAHTAGIADYFEGRRKGRVTTFDQVTEEDLGWSVSDAVEWTRQLTPGTPGRGLYSDTGYQLLGALIEQLEGTTFADVVRRRIVEPLGLVGTYVFGGETSGRYDDIAPMRLGDRELRIPRAMASVQADGGMVSTLRDAMVLLEAFFDGRLVSPDVLAEMQQGWHPIFFPLEYGTGLMRFRVRRYFSPVVRVPPFVGHSGASGVVMYRCPARGLSIVGTVNQIESRSLPYQLMVRSAIAAGRR
jgi:D-alanyl-D-alanine carboxypeptidase